MRRAPSNRYGASPPGNRDLHAWGSIKQPRRTPLAMYAAILASSSAGRSELERSPRSINGSRQVAKTVGVQVAP